jgi:hypothetical protein
VNKALLVCLPIFRSSEPCQGVATAEEVEVEGNPTGLPQAAPIHDCLAWCIVSLPCDNAWLRDKEEQLCHTITLGLISASRTEMPASTSATCTPSLSQRTQAGLSSSWTCIRPWV